MYSVRFDDALNIVAAFTSFSARINKACISIVSLSQQNIRPWKVVLVLVDEEFSRRELPAKTVAQQI
jgi:hypothetical protein